MSDQHFLSSPSAAALADVFGPLQGGERKMWRGRCGVAEYAFDQAASLPRWTLPETTDVLVTDHRVLYTYAAPDGELVRSGELRWMWPQHLRVQPGQVSQDRGLAATQIQLVCAGGDGSFPALVFAGGDLTTVGDADRLANVIRQAVARFRVDNAEKLGLTTGQARMLSRLLIGPEFRNHQGGEGQTVTLLGALLVSRPAETQAAIAPAPISPSLLPTDDSTVDFDDDDAGLAVMRARLAEVHTSPSDATVDFDSLSAGLSGTIRAGDPSVAEPGDLTIASRGDLTVALHMPRPTTPRPSSPRPDTPSHAERRSAAQHADAQHPLSPAVPPAAAAHPASAPARALPSVPAAPPALPTVPAASSARPTIPSAPARPAPSIADAEPTTEVPRVIAESTRLITYRPGRAADAARALMAAKAEEATALSEPALASRAADLAARVADLVAHSVSPEPAQNDVDTWELNRPSLPHTGAHRSPETDRSRTRHAEPRAAKAWQTDDLLLTRGESQGLSRHEGIELLRGETRRVLGRHHDLIDPPAHPQPHAGQQHAGQQHAGQPHAGQQHAGQQHASQPHAGQPHAGQSHAAQSHPGHGHSQPDPSDEPTTNLAARAEAIRRTAARMASNSARSRAARRQDREPGISTNGNRPTP